MGLYDLCAVVFFSSSDVFLHSKERLSEISTWIKAQPYYSVERRPCGTHVLEPEIVKKIEEIVDNYKLIKPKEIVMKIKPHILYKVCYSYSVNIWDQKTCLLRRMLRYYVDCNTPTATRRSFECLR